MSEVEAVSAFVQTDTDTEDDSGYSSKATRMILIWSIRLGLLLAVAGAWQLTSSLHWASPLFVGSPLIIVRQFFDQLHSPIVTTDLRTTVIEMVVGLAMGSISGFLAGWALSRFELLGVAMQPLISAVNSLPRIALAPLFILWFGLGMVSKIALSISLVFFVMLLNTVAGLEQADRDMALLADSLGLRGWKRIRLFVLPNAAPSLIAGLELGIVYSFLGVVTGELIGGSTGLGVALNQEATAFQTNDFFATLLILAITTTIAVQILHAIGHRYLRWKTFETAALEVS